MLSVNVPTTPAKTEKPTTTATAPKGETGAPANADAATMIGSMTREMTK